MLRGKKEKPFRFSFLGQQVHFADILKFGLRTFGRTILLTSGVSKKKRDTHDTRKPPFPQLETTKPLKKLKIKKKISEFF